ncbi:MAG: tRNA (adenosine(37)-N6)-threonylcarbamoyltransferase complex ATPase subunit type 1 TsaE [Nitrospinae bacterium]|nr:tRNA (adenosine(37)-N6)-threonylcarbamoyltransferase complex ATPase subunit type 1 TsaE [Nitrospinota bacterium]
MEKYKTISSEETIEFGGKIGRKFSETRLFLISGDYGVGKTTFIKGLVAGIFQPERDDVKQEIIDSVKSPSFTLVNEYDFAEMTVYHSDFYRLNSVDDIDFIDFEEILQQKNKRVIIEWFDKISSLKELRKDFQHLVIQLHYDGETERIFSLEHNS